MNLKKTSSIKTYLSLFLIGSVLSVLISPSVAKAQTPDLGLNIAPPLTHVIIQPGKTALATVTIENKGVLDLKVTPHFVDFSSDNKSGHPILEEEMSFPYITLQDQNIGLDQSFDLKTDSQRQLLFEIHLPESTLEKEYHFSLVLETEPSDNQLSDSSNTSVHAQVVSNFIVTVTRSAQDQGKIELYSFEGPIFLDSLMPMNAKILVKNVGKNTTVTMGHFRVQNVFNKIVYENEILPENILPDSTREVFGSKQTLDGAEAFQEETPFHYKGLFLLGPYKIIFTYHAPGQEEQTFEHTVFALPVSVLILLVVIYILYLIYTKTSLFTLDRNKETKETGV